MTKALVIGYGSIGSRHARILKELGCSVSVLSNREIEFKPSYKNLKDALAAALPDYIVVANQTSEHYATLMDLKAAGFHGTVLVEKPLFLNEESFEAEDFEGIFVGYNLRFHPLIRRLKEVLDGEKMISVQAYVGKYLPEWRARSDYRAAYSARKNSGGGVLRDLSHELDYLNWMLGGWESVTAIGGHFSHLEIDSDDVFCLMLAMRRCPMVTVQMNYLDRVSRREVLVNTDARTIKMDLISGTLEIDEKKETHDVDRDFTYREEHMAVLHKNFDRLASLEEGLEIMRLINAAEHSVEERMWVRK